MFFGKKGRCPQHYPESIVNDMYNLDFMNLLVDSILVPRPLLAKLRLYSMYCTDETKSDFVISDFRLYGRK